MVYLLIFVPFENLNPDILRIFAIRNAESWFCRLPLKEGKRKVRAA